MNVDKSASQQTTAYWGNTIFWHDGPIAAWLMNDDMTFIGMASKTGAEYPYVGIGFTPQDRHRFMRGDLGLRAFMLEPDTPLYGIEAYTTERVTLTPLQAPVSTDYLPAASLTWFTMAALDEASIE